MKKLYFLLIAFGIFTCVNAQIVNIPDVNFKAKLLEANSSNYIARDNNLNSIEIDINHNGEIDESEAITVYTIYIPQSSINDITGIQSFSNLKELYCSGNNLTTLNLNGLLNLERLNLVGNKFTSLSFQELSNLNLMYLDLGSNPITTLDVSGLKKLVELKCEYSQLTELNVSGLLNLDTLLLQYNNLTTVDLNGLINLRRLECNNNKMITLDVSGLVNLISVCFFIQAKLYYP